MYPGKTPKRMSYRSCKCSGTTVWWWHTKILDAMPAGRLLGFKREKPRARQDHTSLTFSLKFNKSIDESPLTCYNTFKMQVQGAIIYE